MKKYIGPNESEIQQSVVAWWALAHRGLGVNRESRLFHVANGGFRSRRTAGRLKAEGVRKGIADFLLLIPRSGYHGLAIEMKRPGGHLRPEQTEFLRDLVADGYCTAVCFSLDDAIKVLTHYLTKLPQRPA